LQFDQEAVFAIWMTLKYKYECVEDSRMLCA